MSNNLGSLEFNNSVISAVYKLSTKHLQYFMGYK